MLRRQILSAKTSILHLLKRKVSKLKLSGKTNFDNRLHYNIRCIKEGAFYPQGAIAHGPQGVISKSDVRHDTAMF